MAELQFEAPLASFETEEWNDFNEFQAAVNLDSSSPNTNNRGMDSVEKTEPRSGTDNFGVGETFSGSLQDLVNNLDEKIAKCFCNYDEKVEKFAPVQIRTQEEIMNQCQMWWTITGNFGNILPIDWSSSYVRKLHNKALNLGEEREPECQDLDLSDDEELAQSMDYHSMIISNHHDPDHIVTADEVIRDIEYMMEDSNTESSTPSEPDFSDMPVSPYTKVKETLAHLPTYTEQEMKGLSNTKLNEVLNDYELTIKELSETLVTELALRDELEYDKELKNQFISLLLTIQKKRRESNVDKKKRRSKNFSSTNNNNQNNNNNNNPVENAASSFLTTVIPYHTNQGPPTSEQLQIYIKILQAINEDSPSVPTLLTDYILKVLCPT